MRCLREREMEDVTVLAGGIIPEEDREPLLQAGIGAIFGPGTSTQDIVGYIRDTVAAKQSR